MKASVALSSSVYCLLIGLASAGQASVAFVDSDSVPPCIAPGARLLVDTSPLKGRGESYPDHRLWAFSFEMPSAYSESRKGDMYKESLYLRNVLDFLKPVKGSVPTTLPFDTEGLMPGDYRVNLVINRRLHPFAFRIKAPDIPVSGDWEGALPLKWRLSDGPDGLRLSVVSATETPVAFFVDPVGDGRTVYRMVFAPDGSSREAKAVDDNTNTDTFTFDTAWRSRATVSTRRGENGGWRLDATVPYAAVDGGEAAKGDWGVFVSSDERVTRPADYPKRRFTQFVKSHHAFDLIGPKGVARKIDGKLALSVSTTVRNRSDEFRLFKVRTVVETMAGETVDSSEKGVAVLPGKTVVAAFDLGAGKVGNGDAVRLRCEIFSLEGVLERAAWRDLRVAYAPVSIKMTEPCYRDCVFESMGLKRLVGVATLEEGVGRPLEIVLEGPDTHETVSIASAQVSNRFEFAFADKAKGDYFIRAGKATKRIRNLPFKEKEFWVDGDGVMHRGKEKFFPFGWYSEVYRRMYPEINISQAYDETMRTTNAIVEAVANASAHGCALIVSPFQNFRKIPFAKLFGKEAAQGEFDAAPYAEERVAAVTKFAETVRELPDFFAYYLQDEPEGRDLNPDFYRAAKELIAEVDPYHPTMLVNCTVEGAARFRDSADIISTDKYCVYIVGGDTIGPRTGVYSWAKAAADNGVTSMFTPQVFDWDYYAPGKITRAPTYDELREQFMLGLIANVKGFLLYSRYSMNPPTYHLSLGPELVHREILEAKDLFLAPSEPVGLKTDGDAKKLFAALKRCGDDVALLAVNCASKPQFVTFHSENLPRRLYVGGEAAPLAVSGDAFSATLPPFGTAVWYAKPKVFSPVAAHDRIEAAEAGRRKPGNLACAKRFLTWVELCRAGEGKLDYGLPRVMVSSARGTPSKVPASYFLQDGFSDTVPYLSYHGWAPRKGDSAPSVTVELDGCRRISRIVVTCAANPEGEFCVSGLAVEANGKQLGTGRRTSADGRVSVEFPPVETSSVVIHLTGSPVDGKELWLSEVEVY